MSEGGGAVHEPVIYKQKEDILIRDMVETDGISLCRADKEEAFIGSEKYASDMAYYEKQLNHVREKECAGLTAVCQGEIAGYVYLYYQCKWGGMGNQGYPGVVDLYVREKFRKKGIGQDRKSVV